MKIPLNPMSATLGALVIAIATEFSVILASRYREERRAGRSVGEALRHSYERTGVAVLASGATATAGFAALIVSDIRMLRDFGLVTVVDLGVALLGVMLVLPAVLVLAEERFGREQASRSEAGRPQGSRLLALRRHRLPRRDRLRDDQPDLDQAVGVARHPRREARAAVARVRAAGGAGAVVGDANIAQDDCKTSQNPCPAGSRRKAACQVRGPGIVTVCDWFRRPLVISFWFTRGGNCEAQQDVVDRAAPATAAAPASSASTSTTAATPSAG